MSTGEPLRVAVPWSLSRYMPLNGFHPLAQSWFDGNAQLGFRGVDLPALAQALEYSGYFARETGRRAQALARAWIDAEPDLEMLASFIDYATPEELWATRDLPGDIEFHHTSPMTAGGRPFAFYCEAFLPIFFPFLQHSAGVPEEYEEVRRLFRTILGSPDCIGILSHMPATLEEISRFFGDTAIDAKLAVTRVGVLEKNLRYLLSAPRTASGDGPVFLFTNSAHQSPHSIPLRGGRAVLLFAERYLRAGHPGRFVLRTARPSAELLASWGVDAGYLRSHEPERVAWLEDYLDAEAQMALFASADVMLLPSAGLHSLTLMQSMAAGAIPVVTDTFGTEHFVDDERTGIVLRGTKQAVWQRHEPSGILFDRHEAFPALTEDLVRQMFERLVPLLANPSAVTAMRERMRTTARERFSGDAYRDSVSEELVRRWHGHREQHGARADAPSLLEKFGAVQSGGWDRLFTVPPVPRRRSAVAGEQIFAGGTAYFRVRGPQLPHQDGWSPFALRRHGLLGAHATRIFRSLDELQADSSLSAMGRMVRNARARLEFARRR